METRQLGKNGPTVPVICLGAWPLGGGMGDIPDDQAIATIHASIEAGVNFIDTAEGYRTSESVLGKALKGRRDDVILATKLSGDHSAEHMASAIENSLRSLGTDYIDLYQLHGPRPGFPIEETMANLLKLRDEGSGTSVSLTFRPSSTPRLRRSGLSTARSPGTTCFTGCRKSRSCRCALSLGSASYPTHHSPREC